MIAKHNRVSLQLPKIQSMMHGVWQIEVLRTNQAKLHYTHGGSEIGSIPPEMTKAAFDYAAYQNGLIDKEPDDFNSFSIVSAVQSHRKEAV